ncbi:MAG: hypothetical protein AAF984_06930 [Verrucomicrobiota bacterium]
MVRIIRLILIGLFLCLFLGALFLSQPAQRFIDGGTYGSWYVGGIQVNEPDHKKWISCLKNHKLNTVSVTVYATQGRWDSSNLWFAESEPSVIHEIRAAKAKGLKVVLIPRVALDHAFSQNRDLWHGMIMPSSDEELTQWFEKYNAFLRKWAILAEQEGVDVMAVGSELKALTHTLVQSDKVIAQEIKDFLYWYHHVPSRVHQAQGAPEKIREHYQDILQMSESYLKWAHKTYYLNDEKGELKVQQRRERLGQHWSDSIGLVRQHFSGALTYAANFDAYHNNLLWSELDMMGINAYFKLRHHIGSISHEQLDETLYKSWKTVFQQMRKFRASHKLDLKPVIFTELGYTSRENTTVEPWSYTGKSVVEINETFQLVDWKNQSVSYVERHKALLALKEVAMLPENEFFRGLLYWKLSSIPEHDQIEPYVIYVGRDTVDPAMRCLRDFSTALSNPADRMLGRELSRKLFSSYTLPLDP